MEAYTAKQVEALFNKLPEAARAHVTFVLEKVKTMFREACETSIKYLESEQG